MRIGSLMKSVPLGTRACVKVPATSANLGPGFDSLGLALPWYDEVEVEVVTATETAGAVTVSVTGEGADSVPRDGTHLVVRTLLDTLVEFDFEMPAIALRADNTIPHGRGLGSSAAAIVAGLTLAWNLSHPGEPVDRDWLIDRGSNIEGHCDNVAPAVLGSATVGWEERAGSSRRFRARRLKTHPDLTAVVFVPQYAVLTKAARGVLEELVPLNAACANIARAALLVHALESDLEMLHEGTADLLHQDSRGELMPDSLGLVRELRGLGFAAFISGAGPTVMVLAPRGEGQQLLNQVRSEDTALAAGFDASLHFLGEGTTTC